MSEPKPTYHTHDVREWCGSYWVFMNGRPYCEATRQEALMAQVAAKPVEDAVKVLQNVAKLETEKSVGMPIVGAWGEPVEQ